MFTNNLIAGASGNQGGFYPTEIDQSLRFNDDDSAYLSRTPASAGNRKTWTWSGWVKLGNIGESIPFLDATVPATSTTALQINSSNVFGFQDFVGGSYNLVWTSSALFRDPSSWYHIVFAYDSTQATSSAAATLWVNGVQQTLSFTAYTGGYVQNRDSFINSTIAHNIGRYYAGSDLADGYLAEVNFIDGTALAASDFGEFKSGVWVAKEYTGSYGTNGFYLPFKQTTVANGMNTVTYTGNGGTQSIEGVGFAPDLVWIKSRSIAVSGNHAIHDTVRGVGNVLFPNLTNAESTGTRLNSFDSDGFTLNSVTQGNGANETFVAWCWDAGSGSPVSNTDGSITSTVKSNPAYGFSVVSYTGTGSNATVGHGLGAEPSMVIVKARGTPNGSARSWFVYTESLGPTKTLYLNETTAAATTSGPWNDTAPTSSVFSLGNEPSVNWASNDYIAYCFAEISGYSKISSFTGNGSTQTITTGFKPAFLLVKNATNGALYWAIYDNVRDTQDPNNKRLFPNVSNAEESSTSVDEVTFTDTGFTVNSGSTANQSGATIIYMAFADTRDAAFWRDLSGNDNTWQPNALQNSDVLIDSPTQNWCVLNPNDDQGATLQEGNLELSGGNNIRATFACPSSGKWYWEGLKTNATASPNFGHFGLFSSDIAISSALNESMLYRSDGGYYENDSLITTWASYTTGDVIGIAVDVDGGEVSFYKNNTLQGTRTLVSQISSSLAVPSARNNTGQTSVFNFGQDSSFAGNKAPQGNTDANGVGDFFYAPPSGFLALAAQNLPTPAIDPAKDDSPADYFNTAIYTNQTVITGVGFAPDFVWHKSRNQAYNHYLYDAVRGTGAKGLNSNNTSAEGANDNLGIVSFDSDGVTWSADAGLSQTQGVGWFWKAGNGTSSNTSGSITSTVSVNQKAGFSVTAYTAAGSTATVGHGLGAEPSMIIIKNRTAPSGYNWNVYHKSLGNTQRLLLDSTTSAISGVWNNTSPTSSVFTIGGSAVYDSGDYIAYVFAPVESYSAFGSYTGNGSTDGPFIHCGFLPSWIMVKRTDVADSWVVHDGERDLENPVELMLFPDLSSAELGSGTASMDFLSNGFKLRVTSTARNASGGTYIYMAFAENPFKYANAR